jgi:arylsulfatase A-like enzyme
LLFIYALLVTLLTSKSGGYPKFISEGFNDKYLPVWLQQAGYGTYYVGKLFNAQRVDNYDSPHAAGWTGSDFLLDPYTYRYLNATFQRNYAKPVSYEGQYVTDVVSEKAHGFLYDALQALEEDGQPFFLTVAPTAPHSDVNIKRRIDGDFDENTNVQSPPIPAERHKDLFPDAVVPRTPNFNPNKPGGASWISRLPRQNQTNVDFNDHWYRSRLRALQAVDEMVDSLVKRLADAGVLETTYIVFSTDNGYTIGQHRRQPGKQCAFEQDINVPFIVRGPGVAEGVETNLVTTHTDVAPTFLALAGAKPPSDFELDGRTMPLTSSELTLTSEHKNRQEHVNVEMWGIIMSEGKYGAILYPNHTYKALRVEAETYSYLYVVWCSGEHELYDMKVGWAAWSNS